MKRFAWFLLVLWLAMLACGGSAPQTAADYMAEYGGSDTVYNNILSLTDCASLQNEFDTASANNALHEPGTSNFKATTGYMVAADERMKALGCYDSSQSKPATADIAAFIQQTSAAALIQTQLASSPTLQVTTTFLPTLTPPVASLPSHTSEPTATIVFIFPTAPASGSGGAVCPCSADTLNCSDFPGSASAQACMEYCIASGAGDIHNLDGDANGVACES